MDFIDLVDLLSFFKNLEKSLQKLLASVRDQSAGILQESGSHPISVNLYKLILKWSISKSDVFVWFWTLCQWNNMAQCSNIDPLGFHNYSLGMDFIICKYDDSKMYKMGTICQKIYICQSLQLEGMLVERFTKCHGALNKTKKASIFLQGQLRSIFSGLLEIGNKPLVDQGFLEQKIGEDKMKLYFQSENTKNRIQFLSVMLDLYHQHIQLVYQVQNFLKTKYFTKVYEYINQTRLKKIIMNCVGSPAQKNCHH